jgi:spermidine/putrescine transport system substrate-binding protein
MTMHLPVLATILLATAGLAAAEGQPVRIFMYSEYIDPALAETFTAKTGYTLDVQLYEAQEEMIAKLQTGGTDQYDVLVATGLLVKQMVALKLVQPLDQSLIPNKGNVAKPFLDTVFDPGNTYSYPYFWGTSGLMYDPAKTTGEPTWAWVFDPAQAPGPFTLLDEARTTLGCALAWQGKSMNSRVPADVKAASMAVAAAKQGPKCLGFAGGVDGKNRLVGGEAAVVMAYNGDAARGIEEQPKLRYAIPKEGGEIWVDLLLVSAKAPNKAGAHALINFLLDADVAAQNANFIQYASPIDAAKPKIKPELLANQAIYPPPDVMSRLTYLEDLGKDSRMWDAAWTAVKSE